MTLDEIDALIADGRQRLAPLEVSRDERESAMMQGEVGKYPGDEAVTPQFEKAGRQEFNALKTDRFKLVDQVKRARSEESRLKEQDSLWGQTKQFATDLLAPHDLMRQPVPTAPAEPQSPPSMPALDRGMTPDELTLPEVVIRAPRPDKTMRPPTASPKRLALNPDDEEAFQEWYADIAQKTGQDPNPDAPEHRYDMRAFWRSGQEPQPDPTDVDPITKQPRLHFSSEFKDDDHPNRFILKDGDIFDTKHDRPIDPDQFDQIATDQQRETISGGGTATGQPVTPLAAQPTVPVATSAGDSLTQAVYNFFQGAAMIPADALKSIAIASKSLDNYLPKDMKDDRPIEERFTYQLGASIDKLAKRLFPADPSRQKEFVVGVLPQALGSMTGFLAGGFVGMAAKAPVTATALLGAQVGGAQQFEEAKDFKASPEVQQQAFWLGSAVGSSEALPIAGILNRFNKATGGSFVRILKESGVTAAQEFLQEWGQQVGSNAVAQQLYDENRSWFEGAGMAGSAGGATGAIVGFLSGILQGRKTRRERQNESTTQSTSPLFGDPPEQPTVTDPLSALPGELNIAKRPPFLMKQQPQPAAPGLPPAMVPTTLDQAPVPLSNEGGRPVEPMATPTDMPMAPEVVMPEQSPLPPASAPVLESPSEVLAAPAMTPEAIGSGADQLSMAEQRTAELKAAGHDVSNVTHTPPTERIDSRPVEKQEVTPEEPLEIPEVVVRGEKPIESDEEFEAKHKRVMDFAKNSPLPDYAKQAIISQERMLDTNKRIDAHLTDADWETVTIPIDELRENNAELWGDTFTHRGSMSKGPIVLDRDGQIIDGNNRTFEAIQRGDRSIEAYRPVDRKNQETLKGKGAEIQAYLESLPQDEAKRAYARALVDGLKSGNLPAEPKNLTGAEIQTIQKGLMDAVAKGTVTPSPVTPDHVVDQAAQEAATSPSNQVPTPTEAMKEAGNYKKGHVRIAGMDISIENPEGSTRSGTDKGGKPWSITMKDHYGYIRGTTGKDKDHIDVFIKPGTPQDYNGPVFVIDQRVPGTKTFDEHKIVMGAKDSREATKLYEQNYAPGWKGLGSLSTFTMDQFKTWLKIGNHSRPAVDYKAAVETIEPRPETKAVTPEAIEAKPDKAKIIPTRGPGGSIEYVVQPLRPGATPETLTLPEKLPEKKPSPITVPSENFQHLLASAVDAEKAFDRAESTAEKEKYLRKVAGMVKDFQANPPRITSDEYRTRLKSLNNILSRMNRVDLEGETPDTVATQPSKSATIEPVPTPEEATHGRPQQSRVEDSRPPESVSPEDVSGPQERGPAEPVRARATTERGRTTDKPGASRPVSPRSDGDAARPDISSERGGRAESGRDDTAVQRSGDELPAGTDFSIGEDYAIPSGKKGKYKANVTAIKLLKQIESEGRLATPDEQAILAQYTGWGGLPQAFQWSNDWQKEYRELEDLLTSEEYAAARASTPNAHYTDPATIRAIYRGLQHLGFKGGRLLEPGAGVGHFFGAMPASLAGRSQRTAIEKDSLSARLAKQLYQQANVIESEYQKVTLPENFFDVAVGNVPFADVKVFDPHNKELSKLNLSLHDYYFAKALSHVRPGGLVAFITSRYTMDKVNGKMRDYIASKADLVGAIRLPETQFKEIANTDVVTDILILQRREEGAPAGGEAWAKIEQALVGSTNVAVNEYFKDHKDMILGRPSTKGTMYRDDSYTVESDGRDMIESLDTAFARMPEKILRPRTQPKSTTNRGLLEALEASDDVKEGAYTIQNNALYVRRGAQFVPVKDVSPTALERAKGLIGIREQVKKVFKAQLSDSSDTLIADTRKELNTLYDRFTKKFGPINGRANKSLFREDPDYPTLQALEKDFDAKTNTSKKADIFTKRVIEYRPKAVKADTAKEAMLVSMNETGSLDWDRMSVLSGKSPEAMQQELKGLIYKDPSGDWQPADSYLSGNIRTKLKVAEAAVKVDPRFQENIDALKAVIPDDLKPEQIDVKLGHGWIPTEIYERFIGQLFGVGRVTVNYSAHVGAYAIKAPISHGNTKNDTTYGTKRYSGIELIQDALASKLPTVYDVTSDDKRIVNQKETLAAREKLQKIQDEFKKWLWSDDERSKTLARLYNDEYNNIRLQKHDGSHLTLPGANPLITLRSHQKNSIWRALQEGNTLLGHVVGAGKTYTMVGIALEARRLRMANKPMIVVPNHLVEQWRDAILQLYPAAKVLTPAKEDFKAANRQRLVGRIATGDWDAVVVAHSQLAKVPVSVETFEQFVNEQVKILEEYLYELKADKQGNRNIIKEIEKSKERLESKLDRRKAEIADRADANVSFEESGVDMLLVDEADLFKNLWFPTRMTRVAGLPNTESQRAYDLFLKTQYLNKITNNRGVIFATGTPISNSMAEVYTMQRYLQPDKLEQAGLQHFDSWARQFGNTVTSMELAPDGSGYRPRTRFAEFVNVPELTQMFRQVMDVQSADDLKLPVPKLRTGKPINVTSKPSEALKQYTATLIERAAKLKSGSVDPRVDNMLKITGDGRNAALDVRLRVPGAPEDKNGKVVKMVNNVWEEYQRTTDVKGTQLVFLDLSTPKAEGKAKSTKGADDDAAPAADVETSEETALRGSVYNDIKRKLVKKGIPEKQIAFIHEADTDAKKSKLFAAVNAGTVRVLIGSTEKLGAGTNVQERLVALHNVDAPWRPRDIEQRNGRGIRQGNQLYEADPEGFELAVFNYATEAPSFDVYMWQTLEVKAKTITQIMKGDPNIRTIQDVDSAVLSYQEMKAIASGNPMILERVKAETEWTKLTMLKSQARNEKGSMRYELASIPGQITQAESVKALLGEERIFRDAHPETDPLAISLDDTTYHDAEEAGKVILDAVTVAGSTKRTEKIDMAMGTYRGFNVRLQIHLDGDAVLYLQRTGKVIAHKTTYFDKTANAAGLIDRMNNALAKIDKDIEEQGQKATKLKRRETELEAELAKPFEYDEKIAALAARMAEIDKALDLTNKDEGVVGGEEGKPPKQSVAQAAGGEDLPAFEPAGPVTGSPSFYDFAQALHQAIPIGGEDILRLTDSSSQYPPELMQALAAKPHVKRLVKGTYQAFNDLKAALSPSDRVFKKAIFAGFSPDDYYHGVNLRAEKLFQKGPDVILLNPWAITWQVRDARRLNHVGVKDTDRATVTRMIDVLVHELTHQQNYTSHKDELALAFEEQLAKNYAIIGPRRLMEIVDALHTAITEEGPNAARPYSRLLSDLRTLTPFWRTGTRVPLEAGRVHAVPGGIEHREDVAGEGTAGRTGPPGTVRGRGTNQTPSVGKGAAFQRRETDQRVAAPQYLHEAEAYRLQRAAEERGFSSSDEDIEARVRAAKQGVKPEGIWSRVKDSTAHLWRLVSREFEHLPDTAEFSPLRTDLLRLAKYKGIAADKVQRDLASIIKPLTRKQYDQFEWKALLSDLSREAEQDRALPFGYTKEKVQDDLERLNEVIERDPVVQRAWEKRQALWATLKEDYQQAMDAIGFDTSKKLTKEDYFRHQVLEYARERTLKGTGSKVRTPTGRGFLKARHGSGLDINANYVQAEFEVMAQMVYDTQVAKVVHGVDEHYNIRKQLASEAKTRNDEAVQDIIEVGGLEGAVVESTMKDFRQRIGMHMSHVRAALELEKGTRLSMEQLAEIADDPDSPGNLAARGVFKAISERKAFVKELLGKNFMTWERLVPDTHDLWQPREGNVFYMADSIPAQLAKALQEGMLAEAGLTADKLRKVMAMGNEREQYVIPKEAKATLDDLSHKEHSWFVEANRSLINHWKQLMLVSPRRVIRYNVRNLTGDADATFVGNPGAFSKYPQAGKELIPVIFKDQPLMGEAKEWAERGGYGSTLQMQELGDVNDLKAFKHSLDRASKGGWLKAPATLWNSYWKAARLSTDYRESIGRYAAYLDYLQQMQESTAGRPKNFGASIPDTVMALPDIRDRAFKLSNELLGAYDRVSVAGQTVRSFWIPFWSWQEVNATRYYRMAKNALASGDTGLTATKGAVVGTTHAAAFLIKAALFWSILQAWNFGMYDDDEEELRDTNPTVANRPHILFGRDDQGKIRYLAGIGALGDLLAWFGLDEFPGLVGDLMHDRMTIGEAVTHAAKAPVIKILGGLTPTVKAPIEMLTRLNFYPDPFHPRPIQDQGDYLGQQTTMGPEIQALRGKPGKPLYGSEDVTGLLVQRTDPKSGSYWTWQGIERKHLERMGKDSDSIFWRKPRGEALANWSRAIKDGDATAEAHWKGEYERLEREKYGHAYSETRMFKDIEKSLRAKAPLAGVTKAERDTIVKGLDVQDKRTLAKAEEYYTETLLQVLPEVRRRAFTSKLQRQKWLTRPQDQLAPHDVVPE